MHESKLISADAFAHLVGKSVTIVTPTGNEQWRVVEVQRRQQHSLRSDPFNVYLNAPATVENRKQGIRTVRLSDEHEIDIFAVPIAASATEISLEVIFN